MIRTRFAPSPTGELHLGGLRTAYFAYALARQQRNGKFFLRIEDTDAKRTVPGAADRIQVRCHVVVVVLIEFVREHWRWGGKEKSLTIYISQNMLQEIGLEYDDEVVVQSKRLARYREVANTLVKCNHAYFCFCSHARLDELREVQARSSQPTRYDGKCSHVDVQDAWNRVNAGEPFTIRMKSPMQGETVVSDEIIGHVKFSNLTSMDDQVLIKQDGWPTYHLASVVDDHDMGITHVIRGDEWLSSTPKHLTLYRMLSWDAPKYAHLPLLLTTDGKKLSKRSPMGASVQDLLNQGYLPSAILNFVALLGWGVNEGENSEENVILKDKKDFIARFSLNQVTRNGAVVDPQRLLWINGMHIRAAIQDRNTVTIDYMKNIIRAKCHALDDFSEHMLDAVLNLLRDRVRLPSEFIQLGDHFFKKECNLSQVPPEVMQNKQVARLVIEQAMEQLQHRTSIDLDSMMTTLKCKKKDVLWTLRWALTGITVGAPIPDTMIVLGREKSLHRLNKALHVL